MLGPWNRGPLGLDKNSEEISDEVENETADDILKKGFDIFAVGRKGR